MNAARIYWYPEEDLGTVIIKEGWAYDNWYETGTARTLEEAIAAAKAAWHVREDHIIIVDTFDHNKALYLASQRIKEK